MSDEEICCPLHHGDEDRVGISSTASRVLLKHIGVLYASISDQ